MRKGGCEGGSEGKKEAKWEEERVMGGKGRKGLGERGEVEGELKGKGRPKEKG